MAQKAELRGKINLDSSGFQRGIQQSKKSVSTFARTLKGSLLPALGAAGAAGAIIGLGRGALQTAKEIKTLSKLSGVGVVEFQKYADAAKTVNIEQDKLADIFKDTSDKVGDFLQSGGGAMADFFENIAPKVGATREEFVGLSGADALQKYFDFLQKAELPHEQMVFYMEAIASDATALIPLLKDGGEAFKILGDGAEQAGRIMSEETIDALDRAAIAFQRFGTFVKVQSGNVLATIMGIGTPLQELAEQQLKAEGKFEGLLGGAGQQKRRKLIQDRIKLLEVEQKKQEEAAEAARVLISKQADFENRTEGEKRRIKEENEEILKKIRLDMFEAEASQNEELIQQRKNELALEEKIQDIMNKTNASRAEALGLAKQLVGIGAGADVNMSGYVTPREQRAFERKKRKEEREQRRKERAERVAESGVEASDKRREAEREQRRKERAERVAESGVEASDKRREAAGEAAQPKQGVKTLEEFAKSTADNTKTIAEEITKNP